jgi:hypothetical protein
MHVIHIKSSGIKQVYACEYINIIYMKLNATAICLEKLLWISWHHEGRNVKANSMSPHFIKIKINKSYMTDIGLQRTLNSSRGNNISIFCNAYTPSGVHSLSIIGIKSWSVERKSHIFPPLRLAMVSNAVLFLCSVRVKCLVSKQTDISKTKET